MHSSFIRLKEIISLHPTEDKKSRFHCFWKGFYEIPERVEAFNIIEKGLSELDIESWNDFGKRGIPQCQRPIISNIES